MIRTAWVRSAALLGTFAAIALFALAAAASANVPLTRVSADPFTNPTSQHATEVEPDTFASGSTVVATFQVGRFFNGGASDIGFARSDRRRRDLGRPGFLPGLTFNAGPSAADSPFERVSDPTVAYDASARHLADLLDPAPSEPRRADGLRQPLDRRRRDLRSDPVHDPATCGQEGRPRQELDRLRQRPGQPVLRPLLHRVRQLRRGRSRVHEHVDGWRARSGARPVAPAGNPNGLGGQPVVQPDGDRHRAVREPERAPSAPSRRPTAAQPGRKAITVSKVSFHPNVAAACARARCRPPRSTPPAPSTWPGRTAASEPKCAANDIVFSTSSDGVELERRQPDPDRRRRQRGRPLHPRPGRRPGHLGSRARTWR